MKISIPENMSIEFDHEKRRALFKQWGPMSKQVIYDSFKYIYEADGFDPEYDYLIDYQNVSSVDVSAGDIREILKKSGNIKKRQSELGQPHS